MMGNVLTPSCELSALVAAPIGAVDSHHRTLPSENPLLVSAQSTFKRVGQVFPFSRQLAASGRQLLADVDAAQALIRHDDLCGKNERRRHHLNKSHLPTVPFPIPHSRRARLWCRPLRDSCVCIVQ